MKDKVKADEISDMHELYPSACPTTFRIVLTETDSRLSDSDDFSPESCNKPNKQFGEVYSCAR